MEKLIFTKEQIDFLYESEYHFKNAKIGIVKNCPRTLLDKIADLYEQATNAKVNRNWGCSVCVFNFISKVGQIYWKEKEYYDSIADKVAVESEPSPVEATEPKKRGRKPKTVTNN